MRRTMTVFAATAALTIVPAAPALAHVEVAQGDVTIAVGFATEPAYAGQPNAVQLLVSRNEQPVTDLAPGDLTAEIEFGGQTTTVAADPEFEVGEWGTPGDYRAPFIPTQPGSYTFHVTGSVDGTDVDFTTKSGPKTFSDVLDPARRCSRRSRRRRTPTSRRRSPPRARAPTKRCPPRRMPPTPHGTWRS